MSTDRRLPHDALAEPAVLRVVRRRSKKGRR